MKPKLIRITTVPESLKILLKGQLKYMSSNGFHVIGVSSNGKSLDELKFEEGIDVFEIEMTRKITPLKDIRSLIELFKLLIKERPNIVHTHTPKAGIVGMLASKIAKVPIRLHTVAGLPLMETTGFKKLLLLNIEKITYWCATKVYPNSKGLLEYIKKAKLVSEKKLHVFAEGSSNGINTNYYNIEQIHEKERNTLKLKFGIKDDDFVFIFVGRLVKDKGINELISAFKLLKNNTKIKLLLVGNYEEDLDPLENSTKEEINKNSRIISVGPQLDVRHFFSISHCLVFPSYREGFPNVVLQSGSMGLPSIVSNINGCNEIIQNGINGILIEKKNIINLYESMSLIYKDKEFYNKLKKNTRNLILRHYEQEIVWKEILLEYKRFLNQN